MLRSVAIYYIYSVYMLWVSAPSHNMLRKVARNVRKCQRCEIFARVWLVAGWRLFGVHRNPMWKGGPRMDGPSIHPFSFAIYHTCAMHQVLMHNAPRSNNITDRWIACTVRSRRRRTSRSPINIDIWHRNPSCVCADTCNVMCDKAPNIHTQQQTRPPPHNVYTLCRSGA